MSTTVVIARPRADVAEYAAEPTNAPHWYANIRAADWVTPPPLVCGSRFAFVAKFLGRELRYTYEVIEFDPGARLVMATAEGPFPMETTYEWRDDADGGTQMSLRNRGEPSGFSKVVAPIMGLAMRRENRKDLDRLKQLLEER